MVNLLGKKSVNQIKGKVSKDGDCKTIAEGGFVGDRKGCIQEVLELVLMAVN